MKKLFLFFAASALVISAVAQKQSVNKNLTFAKKNYVDDKNVSLAPVKGTKAVTSSTFTTSGNGYTLLSGQKMHADQQSKTVIYTSRAGGAYGGTSSDIKMSYTSDYGTSFDSVMFSNAASKRYPGGTLFRTAAGLFSWCSGPITGGSGWIANYMYTSKLDGTMAFDTTFDFPPATEVGSFMLNDALVYTPSGDGFIMGEKSGAAPDYNHINYSIWRLKWNEGTNHFNFVDSTEFTPLLSTEQPPVQPIGLAFSQDGSVGYFWINGEDSITRPNYSTQPLVWKTTDHGTTWTQMPIYDFSQVQEFKDYVWPTLLDSTVLSPRFPYGYTSSDKAMPGTVDNNGNLHLLARVQGGYSIHPDSLSYTFMYEPEKMFDLYTTSTGWAAKYIDTLAAAVDDGTGAAFGDFAMDHRLSISRTEDGTKIFYTWVDNLPADAENVVLPDLYGRSIDFVTGLSTATKNFTAGTGLYASCIYMSASDIALSDAGTYTVPAVVISGATPESEISHVYVSGVSYLESEYVSVRDIEKNIATVSSLYPNPSNGTTNLDITLEKNANVSINIVNLMGQSVYAEDFGHRTIGKTVLTINANDLTAGIYFVTVKAGNSTSTSKMIVK